jgi:hypothetical protein
MNFFFLKNNTSSFAHYGIWLNLMNFFFLKNNTSSFAHYGIWLNLSKCGRGVHKPSPTLFLPFYVTMLATQCT